MIRFQIHLNMRMPRRRVLHQIAANNVTDLPENIDFLPIGWTDIMA
jgi:hypothetical protein